MTLDTVVGETLASRAICLMVTAFRAKTTSPKPRKCLFRKYQCFVAFCFVYNILALVGLLSQPSRIQPHGNRMSQSGTYQLFVKITLIFAFFDHTARSKSNSSGVIPDENW